MSRAQHGRYNAQQSLPDNVGQPVGTGIYVWLQERIEARWPGLVAQSYAVVEQGQVKAERRYLWLIDQLKERDDPEAGQLVEDFEARRKSEARALDQRKRKALLAHYEALLAETGERRDWDRLDHIEKRIEKLKKSIEKAEPKQ